MRQANNDAQSDAAAKRLLSEKIILAHIMKECLEEYKDCNIKDITEKYIEGDTLRLDAPLLAEEYTPLIKGSNTEDKSASEGEVHFDILFRAIVPNDDGEIALIINVESQKNIKKEYPLIKRALYYCARIISSQYGREFSHSEYGKLKKVYSIWVCPNPPKHKKNTLTRYRIIEEYIIGESDEICKDYDLLSVIILNIGRSEDKNYKGILKMLEVLMSGEKNIAEKQDILGNEYGIEMTENMIKEANNMNPWLQRAFDRGEERGIALGKTESTITYIKNIIRSTGSTSEQAMDMLGIPENERQQYLELLTEK